MTKRPLGLTGPTNTPYKRTIGGDENANKIKVVRGKKLSLLDRTIVP